MQTPLVPACAGRAVKVSKEVPALVDELAATVDEMTTSDKRSRNFTVGAVLATCFAPPLARAVTASARLTASLDEAKRLNASVTAR